MHTSGSHLPGKTVSVLTPPGSRRGVRRRARSAPAPAAILTFGCLALGALSLLLSAGLTIDPWGWVLWGREVAHLSLDTAGGPPSWKPLPVLLTTPLSVLGGAAPTAWLLLARSAGIGALLMTFLLARSIAGWPAGILAALAVPLLPEAMHGFLHGYSEGLLLCLVLGAVELHTRDRVGAALALGTLAALDRPEAWAAVVVYAAWAWGRRRLPPGALAAAVAIPPVLWLGGDVWGSGNALYGARSAQGITRAAHQSVATLLSQGFGGGLLALPLLAAIAVLRALPRRQAPVLVPAAVAAGWIGLVVALTALGYPASGRFLVAPEALLCALAGGGAVAIVAAARRRPAAGVAAACLVLAAFAWPAIGRWPAVSGEASAAGPESRLQDGVRAAVRPLRPVARDGVRLGLPVEYHWTRSAIAWELDLHLDAVRGAPGAGAPHALVLIGPRAAKSVRRRAGWRVCTFRGRVRGASELEPLLRACVRGRGLSWVNLPRSLPTRREYSRNLDRVYHLWDRVAPEE
jgi:hypothetical protein